MKKTGKFYGIGVGPGNPDLLTIAAVKTIKKSNFIFEASSAEEKISIAGSVARKIAKKNARFISLVFPMTYNIKSNQNAWQQNAIQIAEKVNSGFICSFVTIGDPMFYSTCSYLLCELRKLIPDKSIEIIPGITAIQTLAAKTLNPIAVGKEIFSVIPAISDNTKKIISNPNINSFAIMKTYKNKKQLAIFLKKHKFKTIYGAKLCMNDELISSDYKQIINSKDEYLSLMILKKQK